MKIIFSPSKGMEYREIKFPYRSPSHLFQKEAEELVNIIGSFSKEELGKIMKIKGDLLDITYSIYMDYPLLSSYPALSLYNGVSFRNLDIDNYSDESFLYLEEHLRIISALYGVVTPFTEIKEYRLDMTMKIGDFSLYSYWKSKINSAFKKGEKIINLASLEFSKILDRERFDIIDIEFRQSTDGALKNISTEGKKMRGSMVDFMAKNIIEDPESLKNFSLNGYSFSEEHSDGKKFFFIKKI